MFIISFFMALLSGDPMDSISSSSFELLVESITSTYFFILIFSSALSITKLTKFFYSLNSFSDLTYKSVNCELSGLHGIGSLMILPINGAHVYTTHSLGNASAYKAPFVGFIAAYLIATNTPVAT